MQANSVAVPGSPTQELTGEIQLLQTTYLLPRFQDLLLLPFVVSVSKELALSYPFIFLINFTQCY